MITLRTAASRGRTKTPWLDSWHTFSFGDYHDRAHMAFRTLRVINDDIVAPGKGFPTHPHRDMEIITVVLEGALEHKDSLGSGSVIRPGDVQHMTAGTGVTHSEFNPSPTERVHLIQIWIMPRQRGLAPAYHQKQFPPQARTGRWAVLASPDGRDGSIAIQQDALLFGALLDIGDRVSYAPAEGRGQWLHVCRGRIRLGDHEFAAGDGAAIEEEPAIAIQALEPSEVLLFDLA